MKTSPTERAPGTKLLLTPEEAAKALSIGRTRIYELMEAGDLASVRLGRSRRIPMMALETFVERLCEESATLKSSQLTRLVVT